MIKEKFKIHKNYFPLPLFQNINNSNYSLIFRSSLAPSQKDQQKSTQFYALMFEEYSQKLNKTKFYNALFYQGQINQFNCKQGKGLAVFDTGDIYEGNWTNNSIEGLGKLIQNENKVVYEGYFKDWKKQGKGKIIFQSPKKFIYNGQFKNNEIEGQGCIQFEDGSKFQGHFSKGRQDGFGVYQTKSMKYEGTWKKGVMQGHGTAVWYSQKGEIISKYTGEYHQGKKHGFGEYETSNGKLLRGNWWEGKFTPGGDSYIID